MFREKSSIPIPYDSQGYIYFYSKRYRKLSPQERELIREVCDTAGGQYAKALFRFVTTHKGAEALCSEFYCSESTLRRCVREYYKMMHKILK